MRKITEGMVRSTEFSAEDLTHLSGSPDSPDSLVGDLVNSNGELFFETEGEIRPHCFRVPEWAVVPGE